MALIESLLSAIVRLDGDALVMHVGEKPYVVTSSSSMNAFRGPLAWGQVELSSKTLTVEAVGAMLDQLLPLAGRRALAELGAVEHEIAHHEESGSKFVVIAARGGDDIWLEIRHQRPAPSVVEAPAPRASESAVAAPAAASPPPPAPDTVAPAPALQEPVAAKVIVEQWSGSAVEAPAGPEIELVPEISQEAPTEADVEALLAASGSLVQQAAQLTLDETPADEWSLPADTEGEEIPIDLESVVHPPLSLAEPIRSEEIPPPHGDKIAAAAGIAPIEPAAPSLVEARSAVVVPIGRVVREAPPPVQVVATPDLDRLLRIAAARGASALYAVARSKPVVRVDGEMQTLDGEETLTPQAVEAFMMSVAPEPTQDAVRAGEATEWMCDLAEVGRVRCLSFRDHRGPGVIFRMLPPRAISAEQLGLSKEVQALSALPDGLVLVAGPRGSGTSTLVAAFVDLVNRTRSEHVITIESQIFFLHEGRRSFVSQREVRGHGDQFGAAVRAALREDPDVLVIEELRSAEAVAAAIEAAQSGRLIFGGLRASATGSAIERLLEQVPAERRPQLQSALAGTLRGVVAQALLRKRGGGRVAARELLLNTPHVAALIAEGKLFQIPAALQSGRKLGMAPLNDALAALVRAGTVDPGEAYRKAVDRDGLVAQLKRDGVDTSFVERLA
jgi:twitching motility protein PilT